MKKIFTGLCAVAAMALSGCSQEEEQFMVSDAMESFSGVMEVNESRTALGNEGKVVWSDGDAISIFKRSGYQQKYQVENGGSIEATFKYAGESAQHGLTLAQNYAVYPYSANHKLTNEGVFTVDLASLATQNYTKGSFEDEKSVMTAKSSGVDLFFYNALSMIRFRFWSEVPGDYSISSITLTSKANSLNGTATVDMSEDKPVAVFTQGGNTTTLKCTDAVVLETEGSLVEGIATGGHDFYMMLPAGTYEVEDLTIRIEGADGNGNALVYEVEYPTSEALTLKRSEIYTIYKEFQEETWTGSIETGWDGTTITPVEEVSNVYEITTPAELAWVADQVNGGNTFNGKTIKLMNNIDLGNKEWTPIGNSTNKFQGTFDGQEHVVSNLNITGNSRDVGLFGYTTVGEVKNLTVNNAKVSGRLNVGVVAGNPYTSKYTNIKVTGHVEVNGMSYVGGVGGRNAYANWTDITVDVDASSYVKANSVENGKAYRTYVGGVVGFNGEGGHSFTNIKSNINVSGSTCDVGGLFGIAHYGNKFENCSSSGNVEITAATEASDAEEIGGIAGVWHNGGADVVFTGCSFTGTLKANVTEGVDLSDNTITGKAYSDTDTGLLVIDGVSTVENVSQLTNALEEGRNVLLRNSFEDFSVNTKAPYGNYYGVAQNGGVLDGDGYTLDFDLGELNDGKADNYGIMTSGGTIKNVTITGVFRGIMIMNPTQDLYIDNITIGDDEDMCYSINTGEGDGTHSLYVSNSTIKGWNSYGTAIKDLTFTKCTFAQGKYYTNVFGRLVKPYVNTLFDSCEFNSKHYIDLSAFEGTKVTLKNCTVNGVKLTAENWKDLIVAESDCGEGQISVELKDGSYLSVSNNVDYVVIE